MNNRAKRATSSLGASQGRNSELEDGEAGARLQAARQLQEMLGLSDRARGEICKGGGELEEEEAGNCRSKPKQGAVTAAEAPEEEAQPELEDDCLSISSSDYKSIGKEFAQAKSKHNEPASEKMKEARLRVLKLLLRSIGQSNVYSVNRVHESQRSSKKTPKSDNSRRMGSVVTSSAMSVIS